MLSRVAENLYWCSRYIERAEDLARLVNVNSILVLDLPGDLTPGWAPLVQITGNLSLFEELYEVAGDREVVRFLVSDMRNPGSILNTLSLARENLRTTRELVPLEAWEQLNNLFLSAREEIGRAPGKGRRYEALSRVILGCQQFVGVLEGTMSHGESYEFMRLGRNLERADMTTRIVEVRARSLLVGVEDLQPFEAIQWMSVLKSLTAYQMYRRHVRLRVSGADVVGFLLHDELLPRSVTRCLRVVEACLRSFPRNDDLLRNLTLAQLRLAEADVPRLVHEGLGAFLDGFQVELGRMHRRIAETYFLPAIPA